ncbi:MAG TPA: hypothetical protein VI136_15090 [Verrucomicrobiae bacterium]
MTLLQIRGPEPVAEQFISEAMARSKSPDALLADLVANTAKAAEAAGWTEHPAPDKPALPGNAVVRSREGERR